VNRATFDHLWEQSERVFDHGVDGTFHMRQTATLIERDGYPPEMVFAGPIHDLFKPVSMVAHGEIAAVAFDHLGAEPSEFLRSHSVWVAAARAADDHGLDGWARTLGRLDMAAFDPRGPCEAVEHFGPLLDRFVD
jgi:predicted HD phosphohydrolase